MKLLTNNLSVWPTFQLVHSTIFQRADLPGARTGGLPQGGPHLAGRASFKIKANLLTILLTK